MMKSLILCWLGAGLATLPVGAETNLPSLPPSAEIVDILKTRFVDRDRIDDQLLNEATIRGLLGDLGQGAQILSPAEVASNAAPVVAAPANALPLARAEIIDPDIGYIRIRDLTPETVAALDEELKKYTDKKVSGYVLDLRFADGTNYQAVVDVASRFMAGDGELFSLKTAAGGVETFRAAGTGPAEKPDASDAPLMLLVNARTRGSAETLAGALRTHDRGIVVGARTAGLPVTAEDVMLSDGNTLRVATAKIVLPGGQALFPKGLTPDVPVKMNPALEREVVLNGQTNVTLTASLQPKQKKKTMTEAELVKAFRGEVIDVPTPGSEAKEEEVEAEVKDVVLQRAVDILKGIRVLQSWNKEIR